MLGRGKRLRPRNGNVQQTDHPSKGARGVARASLSSGKVFRKNAGRPWSRAQQLG
jgi:hypothetical protein